MKLVRLTVEPEPGSDRQDTYIDICLENMSYAIEYNGTVEVHFGGGDKLELTSTVWDQLKSVWLEPETVTDDE